MYGEGYDWAQQYSVSSADFVGSLPVGMQSRGVSDLPYWPSQNTYVYKEVWVHSSSRWLWLMEDLLPQPITPGAPDFTLSSRTAHNGDITITLVAQGEGTHRYSLRTDNVRGPTRTQTVVLRPGVPATLTWKVKRARANTPWAVVVIEDNNVALKQELFVH
jgi:hypothetical protein